MIRFTPVAFALALGFSMATAAQADEVTKEDYCAETAKVVGAIQQARLDRVDERDVREAILASDPEWPDNYDNAIVQLAPWVYQQKRRDLRKNDLSAVWSEQCLANWDAFKDSLN
ncbi:MAG: hypothetical protein CML66_06185 [Rhodobacteraceae bacterium]|nr:hypothetical protein [Paracoccaceae bacterium]QEW21550.1 hypothetical protein LA6_003762 [Marinibacterium anthonyi]